MKKLIETKNVKSGLEQLLGERIVVWCLNYIYSGVLVSVGPKDIELENAHVVYETGPLQDKQFKDAQPLPGSSWFIRTQVIESYGRAASCS